MPKRLRCLAYIVQPQFVIDDGENLTPLPVDPINVLPADWPNVVEGVEQATAVLRAQVEEADAPTPPNRAARRANGKAKASA